MFKITRTIKNYAILFFGTLSLTVIAGVCLLLVLLLDSRFKAF